MAIIGKKLTRPAGLDRSELRDQTVIAAIARVPRECFVAPDLRESANDDRALPIDCGQTISQPFIVALSIQEARVQRGSKVLEVGVGSGYQAAVLAEIGARVFALEIVPELAETAKERLNTLGYENVDVRTGDGWLGLEEEAPFDAIIVAAATPGIPPELFRQLREGGTLVIPVESDGDEPTRLLAVEKHSGSKRFRDLGAVKFVPLTGIGRDTVDALDGEKHDKE